MSIETRIAVLQARKNLLASRDAMGNDKLIKKIARKIRALEKEKYE